MKVASRITYRKQRLEREIYKEAVGIIGYQVKNPLISSMYVTRVELSDNLQFAHIYLFSDTITDPSDVRRVLLAASPFVQNRLNMALNIKRKLQVRLFFDRGLLNKRKIEHILDSLDSNEERFAEK